MQLRAQPLTAEDLALLEESFITPELAEQAGSSQSIRSQERS